MAEKEIKNLYSILEFDNDEVLIETPLASVTEKDILKYNIIFTKIVDETETNSRDVIRTLSTGFNSVIYNIFVDKFKDEDVAYDKTKEFETFLDKLVLNTKVYFRGKEMSFPEFKALKNENSIEINMRFNICFFLSMFIVLSNSLKLEKIGNLTEIQKDVSYIGSSSIGEFHSFVVNLKMGKSSQNTSSALPQS